MQLPSSKRNILSLLQSSLCFEMCDGTVAIISALRWMMKFDCSVNLNVFNVLFYCFLGVYLIGTQHQPFQCQCCWKRVFNCLTFLKLILSHGTHISERWWWLNLQIDFKKILLIHCGWVFTSRLNCLLNFGPPVYVIILVLKIYSLQIVVSVARDKWR